MSDDATPAPGPLPRRPRPPAGPRPAGTKSPRPPGATQGGAPTKRRTAGAKRPRPTLQAPSLPSGAGAAGAGVLVGVAAVVLVALGMQACELLRDSPSCGGPGLLMLIAIVVALIVIGRALLAFVRVPDPFVVSFLGVVLALVAVLAGFVEHTFSVWMWLVMPLLGAATFALCHFVLTVSAKPDADA